MIGLRKGGIGLDIGTSAVRAAEIRPGGPPLITQFGQILLPPGAMVAGEVEEPDTVAQALSTLWKRVGFRSRRVRIGVGNTKVVVRQIEFPAMPRDELDGAIRYQAQDQIPIPLEDAVLDFQVIDELTGAEGEPRQRVLVVAAQRGMIDNLLDALSRAKLQPDVIEMNAYPLIRALSSFSPVDVDSEAIVDIGAAMTNVIVHQAGKIRFVRPLTAGGDDFTTVISTTLGIEWDEAESIKLSAASELAARLSPGHELEDDDEPDEATSAALDALVPRVQRFVEEIRGTLDYYAQLPDSAPLSRVTLAGGGSLLGGLLGRLSAVTRMEVERARPFSAMNVGKTSLPEGELHSYEPYMSVAVGLALGSLEV